MLGFRRVIKYNTRYVFMQRLHPFLFCRVFLRFQPFYFLFQLFLPLRCRGFWEISNKGANSVIEQYRPARNIAQRQNSRKEILRHARVYLRR